MQTLGVICCINLFLACGLVSCQSCNNGFFWDESKGCVKCPDNCQFCESNEYCLTCMNGYWGNACEQSCSACKADTSCDKTNGFCLESCKDGYTGVLCDSRCSEGCSSCNRTNAHICSSCAYGWYPPVSCNQHCPEGCYNRTCNATGICMSECEKGFWGEKCERNCSGQCKKNMCYRTNGTCEIGCKDGFTGTQCDISARKAEKTTNVAVVATVIVIVIALALVLGAVFYFIIRRRKKQRSNDTQTPEEQQEMMPHSGGKENTKTGDNKDDTARDDRKTGASSQSNEVWLRRMCLRLKRLCCFGSAHDNDETKEPENPVNQILERKKMTKEEKLRECLNRINFPKKSDSEYEDEFRKLPSGKLKPNTIRVKNQSKLEEEGVFPYDENRVEIHGHDGKELYVNASHIKDKADEKLTFIASAGLSKKEHRKCMWRLCWEQGCQTVVMLDTTDRIKENKYWPKKEKTKTFDTLSVKCTFEAEKIKEQQHITRAFRLTEGRTTKNVMHLQYTDWPEKGVPANLHSFLKFLGQVKLAHMKNVGPLLVHSRCGTGRTGTFLALYILSKEVEDMLDSDKEQISEIYSCVANLRNQRVKMVETIEQYKFLHEALSSFVSELLENMSERRSKNTGTPIGDEDEDKN